MLLLELTRHPVLVRPTEGAATGAGWLAQPVNGCAGASTQVLTGLHSAHQEAQTAMHAALCREVWFEACRQEVQRSVVAPCLFALVSGPCCWATCIGLSGFSVSGAARSSAFCVDKGATGHGSVHFHTHVQKRPLTWARRSADGHPWAAIYPVVPCNVAGETS